MAEAAVIWSTDFENFPSGHHFGSVTAFAVRRLKSCVEDLLSIQHTWDDSTSPEMTHEAGLCTVCGLSDESPSDIYDVTGALWFDYTNGSLLRDFGGGVGLAAIGGTNHGDLINLDDDAAHTQYILLSGSSDIDNLSVPSIKGLSVDVADYTTGGELMSRGLHLTTPADHEDAITDNAGLSYGYDKLNVSDVASVYDSSTSYSAGTTATVSLGRGSLMPRFGADTTTGLTILTLPLYAASPPDNWEGGFTAYWYTAGRCVFERRTLA
jgi:hypothetical protein